MRYKLTTLVLAAALVLAGGVAASAQTAPAAGVWSASDCQTCHEATIGPKFQHTKHAGLSDSCASCHLNVAEHVKAQMAGDSNGPVPSIKKLTANQINTTCLTCHEKAKQATFLSSMHARRDVPCTSCHSVHNAKSPKAQLRTVNDADTCYTCHKAFRAKMQRVSHHPVREGKMACSACHNPHEGSTPSMLSANSINEKCYQCHTEKRGPFLHEHAPVRTNCATCHDPHGSNHEKLLNASMPYVCQRCHFSGGHPGNLYDLNTTLAGSPVAPPGGVAISSRSVDRDCKNCHSQFHGSNSYSGVAFGR